MLKKLACIGLGVMIVITLSGCKKENKLNEYDKEDNSLSLKIIYLVSFEFAPTVDIVNRCNAIKEANIDFILCFRHILLCCKIFPATHRHNICPDGRHIHPFIFRISKFICVLGRLLQSNPVSHFSNLHSAELPKCLSQIAAGSSILPGTKSITALPALEYKPNTIISFLSGFKRGKRTSSILHLLLKRSMNAPTVLSAY